MPLTAAFVRIPRNVPPLGLLPTLRITIVVLVVRLPKPSRMRTVTAGTMAAEEIASVGCTPKFSCAAGPGTMFALKIGAVRE